MARNKMKRQQRNLDCNHKYKQSESTM